jgi:hypothetical protein
MIKPLLPVCLAVISSAMAAPIDRQALAARHSPRVEALDYDAPMTVGNGSFALSVGITGLQDFTELYHRHGIPLETLSRWAWVSDGNPENYTLADASLNFRQADGLVAPYPTRASTPAGEWLRRNPRNHPLGQIRLDYAKADGSALRPEDIAAPEQRLDLYTGIVTSRFMLEGEEVVVRVACHPQRDAVAVRLESALVQRGKLAARIDFPRGHDANKNTPGLDWSKPEEHRSSLTAPGQLERRILDLSYRVRSSALVEPLPAAHAFRFTAAEPTRELAFVVSFERADSEAAALPLAEEIFAASAAQWERFWTDGAAIDFSGSSSPLAHELERRITLSRYLMAAQMAGEVPPQESGLTCSTWYGKHHTEMIWWHAAHFALWGNDELLQRNLDWYRAQLPNARALASSRGLTGARWAKMVGPDGRESPGGNPLIIWNQPHMVYLSELLYRSQPTTDTLERCRELVFETAECMAAMAHFDPKRGESVLGPPLWIAQEIYDQATSQNPSFELAYWRWGLEVAQQWRLRLGLEREPRWDRVIATLAPLPQKDGKYVALESHPDTWDNVASRHDHPTMLAPLGLLPGGPDVDRATMERTLDAVLESWDWETKIWGWDYPMIAMTAARLGRPQAAVEMLLRDGPNNAYLTTGHVPQRSDEARLATDRPGARKREIAVYLPANGALLATVALMAAGWDGAEEPFPGFPKDGSWTIRAEGLKPLP